MLSLLEVKSSLCSKNSAKVHILCFDTMCMNHQWVPLHLTFDANPFLSTSLPIAFLSSLIPSMTNFSFLNRLCGHPSLIVPAPSH